MKLLIYTEKVTHRTRYIFQLFFGQLLGVDYETTAEVVDFESYQGPKISYARAPLEDELHFHASGLLFQRGIEGQELSFIDYRGTKVFFPSFSKRSAMPFDPFAAAFYLVSRYEEYLPYRLDEFGRFSAVDSISFQKGFLHKPVINMWAEDIARILREKYQGLQVSERHYRFIPTIDIDSAWQFREKGFLRSVGGYFRSFFQGDILELQHRTRVLLRVEKDPFDTYDEQLRVFSEFRLRPIYFILFGDYGLNDKNIQVFNPHFQVLVKSLADYADIGIHSSFKSSYDGQYLQKELARLSSVIHRDIFRSRQHYLRLNLPYMYRNLLEMNITEDYSMGYNSHHGFRAGLADPFYFYDLDLDMPTRIKVFPFAFSINKFWRPDSEEKVELIRSIIDEGKKVKGTLVGAWDNEALSSYRIHDWQGNFRRVLEFGA